MAGLVPKEAQYGDKTTLRRMGMKDSPVSGTPTLFKPQGGRPPEAGAQPAGPVVAPAPANAAPVAGDIPLEEQSLYDRSANLAAASQAWIAFAESPLATEKVKRIALALKEAARIAALDAREGTPFNPGL
jgi:hypothetical protein